MTSMVGLAGLILAGGQGRRMGYQNKGLMSFCDGQLIDHAIHVLQAHCSEVIISANQDLEQYQQKGCAVYPDAAQWQDKGPLAGVVSCLPYFSADIQTIQLLPCDSPLIPSETIAILARYLQQSNHLAVYAETEQQTYPVICQFKRGAFGSLVAYLQQQNHNYSIRGWLKSIDAQAVFFTDDVPFININSPDVLAQCQLEIQA